MERQRYLEWEKQRIQDLENHHQKELEFITSLRERYARLNSEYQSLVNIPTRDYFSIWLNDYSLDFFMFQSDKVRELSQQTGETRNGVNAVKTTIDGMRANRDTLLSDMASLKNQLKEQNQRLILLNQEKTNLESKKHSIPSADSKTQEQLKFDVMNQQIVVNQLQEEVKAVQEDVSGLQMQSRIHYFDDLISTFVFPQLESRKVDYNNNVTELTQLKDNTAEIIKTCETLYSEYCDRKDKVMLNFHFLYHFFFRINITFFSLLFQVLELKSSKLKDVSSWGDAAWNTADAWGSEPEPAPAADASGVTKYRALYEFVARNNDELSFQPGDLITATFNQSTEPGWLAGELQGKTGWFPESYVEIFDGQDVPSDTINEAPVGYTNGDPSLEYVICIFIENFKPIAKN